jgi:uncharacterized protein
METFKIGNCEVERGQIGFGKLLLEPLPDGGEIFIPLIVVHGQHDGPVLWLGSAIHGREVPGIEVTRRIMREIVDPKTLRGTIIGAAILNPYGFRSRLADAPMDPVNLNAQFPGDAGGSISQRAAHTIVTQALPLCDYAIDFHAATPLGTEFMCLPVCADRDVMTRSLEIAQAFGFPLIEITRDMYGYDHSLVGWAQDHGKPGFVCEVKALQRVVRQSVPHGVRGILNVMKTIGMIDGAVEPQSELPGAGGTYRIVNYRPAHSGVIFFHVNGGDWVSRGDLLGTVRDMWGNTLDEVRSPCDGLVRTTTDEQAVYAGKIIGTILEPHPRETLWQRVYKS